MNKDLHFDRTFASAQFTGEKKYWLEKLAGDPGKISFPGRFKPPGTPVKEGTPAKKQLERLSFKFPRPLYERLMEVIDGSDSRLHMVLVTGLILLLHHYTGDRDITIATPIDKQEVEGEFINTVLPLRAYTREGETFKEFLMQVRQTIIEAVEHQNYPVETLPFDLGMAYSPGDDFPLFDVAVVLENTQDRHYLDGVQINLVFSFLRTEKELRGTVEYSALLFDKPAIARISGNYLRLLQYSLGDPGKKLAELCLVSETEQKRLLIQFNETAAQYPVEKTIHELFAHQVEKTPDSIAVMESGSMRMISYRELNKRAGSTAGLLKEKGVEPGKVVPVMGQRCIEIITGILGILKAGGAYLPIDAASPPERIKFLIRDSRAELLLTQEHVIGQNREALSILPGDNVIPLDKNVANQGKEFSSLSPCAGGAMAGDPAYVIYTSGTTGKPKGVMIAHGAAVNYLCWAVHNYVGEKTANFALYTSISFDMTVTSIFTPLITGGAIVLYGGDYSQLLVERILEEKWVDILKLTPSHLKLLREKELPGGWKSRIKRFIVGGEALDTQLAKDIYHIFNKDIEIYNEYGPTEAAVGCMLYRYKPGDARQTVPIGVPAANMCIYLLNGNLVPVPPGITGEIYIKGPGLALGYLNRPELTAEKFINFHHSSFIIHHSILYRTGDLAQWLPGGILEFIGRGDEQVKIRGYRIEPGEIENRLTAHEGICGALVLVREDEMGDRYLCAYITWREGYGEIIKAQGLREYLSRTLPEYMIPSFFVILDKFPLTANGKIDRKALPEPKPGLEQAAVPPRNRIEKRLAAAWAEILGIGREVIGIDDDYFSLGGHSLNATVLAARINKEWEVKLSLIQVFQNSTIRKLARCIKEATRETFESIEPVEIREYYDVSSAQQRLYVLQQMDPGSTYYNIPIAVPLEGEVEVEKIQAVFQTLIARHESLRTSFVIIKEKLVQRVHPQVDFQVICCRVEPGEKDMNRFTVQFDLSRAPLLNVRLIKVANLNIHILFLQMHHIVTDGISMDILKQEFIGLYRGDTLPPLKLQYRDFCTWQAERKQRVAVKQQEEYWLGNLSGELPVLDLPIDSARPAVQVLDGDILESLLSETQTAALKKMAKENDMTLYMVILSLFTILLGKLSGQEDIIVGTPIAGRLHTDLEKIVGMFVNTLVMRNYPAADITLERFLAEVKGRTLEAYENQEYPFDDLVDLLAVPRDTGRNPIFDVMFDFISREFTGGGPIPKEKERILKEKVIAKFELTLAARDYGAQISLGLEYCTGLFSRETIERMVKYFKNLAAIVTIPFNARLKLGEIDIMEEAEKNRLLYGFNNTRAEVPGDKTVHRLFQEQVEKTPDRTALVGTINVKSGMHLSYKELDEKSGKLAHVLREKGVNPDVLVGIRGERSVETVIGILGILKADGAYLPIDPGYPQERIDYILKDSQPLVLLTALTIEEAINRSYKSHMSNLSSAFSSAGNLAYVMYTSGSTGRPKGVAINHGNVVHIVSWFNREYNVNMDTHVVSMAGYAFDSSVEDIFGVLLAGGTLFVAPGKILLEKTFFRAYINSRGINIVDFVPGVLGEFLGSDQKLASLDIVICGGEALVEGVKEAILQEGYRLYNNYGPTEITVDALSEECRPGSKVTLGRPVANTAIYILDGRGHLVPMGVAGELCVAGPGVARGYLNNPELTAERFRPLITQMTQMKNKELFQKLPLVYKTGDRARWLFDGRVEFLGRQDEQVKIMGNRVEPGEIETVLKGHPGVKDAVVVYNRAREVLAAYVVPREDRGLEAGHIRDYLKSRLPVFMEPAYIELIDRIPLTVHGKLNRKALPEPGMPTGYAAPKDEVEWKLAGIWANILHIHGEKLSVEANFFQLGGHSLRAALVAANIHREFNVNVPLVKIFTHSTIRQLAGYIKSAEKEGHVVIKPVEKRDYYVLSSAQKRLYALQQREPDTTVYNMLTTFITGGELTPETIEMAFRGLIERHESLRTSFELVEEMPVQRVHPEVEFIMARWGHELSAGHENREWIDRIIKDFIRPFDLSRAPLLRAGLMEGIDGRCILIVDLHHIISDGISQTILTKDFVALCAGEKLPEQVLHYKDFCQWRSSAAGSGEMKKQETYWLKEFEGYTVKPGIPTDYPRPRLQSFEGDTVFFEIDAGETARLKEIAGGDGATLYMILLAIYNVLLARLSGHEDIVVGTGIAGRRHIDLENIIGIFVDTLALRNYPAGDKTFKEFLGEVRQKTLNAFENQDYFFEDLVEKIFPQRDLSRNPLFDTVFMLDNLENYLGNTPAGEKNSAPLQQYGYKKKNSPFDMIFNCVEGADILKFNVGYCTALFKRETIELFTRGFKQIVTAVAANHEIELSSIMLSSGIQLTDTAIPGYDFEF